jgi:hypothetical protein
MSNGPVTSQSSDRLAGILTIVTALASYALLAGHPGDQARTFADMVHEEAANRQQNLIVHGGYIVVQAVLILCFSLLASRLAAARFAARAGIVLFAIGAAWLSVSLLFDGVVLPAVATRYVNDAEGARPLFVLATAIVRFAMPMALTFQTLAVCAWSVALLSNGFRVSGALGSLLGLALIAAVVAGAIGGMPMAFMGAFAGMGLWSLLAGAVLVRAPASA